MKKQIILILLFSFLSCKKEINKDESKKINIKSSDRKLSFDKQLKAIKNGTSKDSVLSNDIQFINDSILKGKFHLDISKYEIEAKNKDCFPIRLHRKLFNEFYNEGFNNLGDINGDKKDDYVFVLHALNYCEEGDSYYFSDNNISRILTDSNCCHPGNILNIGDIDEDGNSEIAEYYSSCASRYKSISIYSLKNNKWNLIKSFSFVLNDKYYIPQDFKKIFRKTSKNHLEYYEINDISLEGKIIASWEKVKIE